MWASDENGHALRARKQREEFFAGTLAQLARGIGADCGGIGACALARGAVFLAAIGLIYQAA
jgi:hypothetical protein